MDQKVPALRNKSKPKPQAAPTSSKLKKLPSSSPQNSKQLKQSFKSHEKDRSLLNYSKNSRHTPKSIRSNKNSSMAEFRSFKLEYLKDEKISRLSESNQLSELEDSRKHAPVSKFQQSASERALVDSKLDLKNRLMNARINHNMMNNVSSGDRSRSASYPMRPCPKKAAKRKKRS